MATSFWDIVNDVIRKSDILVVVADARLPKSVNHELLSKITQQKKKYIVVFNKVDLLTDAERKQLNEEMKKYPFSIALSAKLHLSTMIFLRKLE